MGAISQKRVRDLLYMAVLDALVSPVTYENFLEGIVPELYIYYTNDTKEVVKAYEDGCN